MVAQAVEVEPGKRLGPRPEFENNGPCVGMEGDHAPLGLCPAAPQSEDALRWTPD